MPLYIAWVEGPAEEDTDAVVLLRERDGARAECLPLLANAVVDNLFGLELLQRLGYGRLAAAVRESMPTTARQRSGDLGEILATEYVVEHTEYNVPIRRLRYKDGRNNAIRGEDLIAIRTDDEGRVRILKGEAKSAARITATTIDGAIAQLEANSSRPSAYWLSFIARQLLENGNDDEGLALLDLQESGMEADTLRHLLFTFTGNDPSELFGPYRESEVERRFVAVVIPDHQDLITAIFERIDADFA